MFSVAYIKDKWAQAGFQKYLQNMGWLFFGRLAGMVISFLATAYIARNLGPSNYGELSYAVSFVSIFSFLAVLGIDQVLYRDLIQHPEDRGRYMGSALALRLVASVLAAVLCGGFALWFSPRDISLFLIFLLSFSFILNAVQIINYEFQANVQSKFPSVLSLYVTIAINVLKILVIVFGKGVIYLAIVLLLESLFYGIGYLYYRLKIYGTMSTWSFDKQIAIKLLKDSWPLTFSSAFAVIYARIDQVMIKNMMDSASVGLYDAAVRLSEVWYFVPGIIASSLFPAIMNAKKVSEELYRSRIRKLAVLLVLLAVLVALPVSIFAGFIIKLVFGSAFLGAVLILQIYIWSNVATSLNSVMSTYLIAENFNKMLLFSTFAGMAANIFLNLFLIPKYGTAGAAMATLISYAIPCLSVFIIPEARKLIRK